MGSPPGTMAPLLLTLLLLLTGSLTQESPDDIIQKEAFNICDSDGTEGLTWAEVEKCLEKYSMLVEAFVHFLPTHEEFDSFDLNKDGTLLLEEWTAAHQSEKRD